MLGANPAEAWNVRKSHRLARMTAAGAWFASGLSWQPRDHEVPNVENPVRQAARRNEQDAARQPKKRQKADSLNNERNSNG